MCILSGEVWWHCWLSAGLASPVVGFLWGLPEDAVVFLLVGILRKDVAVGMFAPLGLTTAQLMTGTIVLAMFFPCIASRVVLLRELGVRDWMKSLGVMLLSVDGHSGAYPIGWGRVVCGVVPFMLRRTS